MTLRTADARLVLPREVRRATVLGDLPQWREALRRAGCLVDGDGDPGGGAERPDLVVTPADRAAAALDRGAAQVLLLGPAPAGVARRTGWWFQPMLTRPGPSGPRLLVPLRHRDAVRYLLRVAGPARTRAARYRNTALSAAVAARLPVERLAGPGRVVTLVTRDPGPPRLLREAATSVAPLDGEWLLDLGDGDDLQRAVFHVFGAGSTVPRWAVKVARVRGYATPFERDERGLALAAGAGPVTAGRAPRLCGRTEVDGLPVSVETAAVGRPLHRVLAGGAARADKERLVDAVAAWTVAVAAETAEDPRSLAGERNRLRALAAARPELPDGAALVDGLPPVPGVLAHHDLGCWNIVADPRRATFTVLDWESARRPALPLWDLLYFLADALPRIGGPVAARPAERVLALFRGESRESATLFRWLRQAVTELRLPPESVGPMATLAWLHHAASPAERAGSLAAWAEPGAAPDPRPEVTLWAETAAAWLADPRLGPGWDAWRQ